MQITQRNTEILVVGLGNPGDEYANTRHNLGFMVVDHLARKANSSWLRGKEKARVLELSIRSKPVLLMKPMTYMNLSGQAVLPLTRRLNLDPSSMIVVHDDLDLDEGKIRIKQGGGDGGHKGLRSIADSLRFNDFRRLRIGIGRPPRGISPEEYVLTPYEADECEMVEDLVERASDAVELIVSKGVAKAQNFLHSK